MGLFWVIFHKLKLSKRNGIFNHTLYFFFWWKACNCATSKISKIRLVFWNRGSKSWES